MGKNKKTKKYRAGLCKGKFETEGQILLNQWMNKENITTNEFAAFMKTHYQMPWNWSAGARRPNLDTAFKIESFTDGFVTAKSWTSFLKPKLGKTRQDSKKKARASCDNNECLDDQG